MTTDPLHDGYRYNGEDTEYPKQLLEPTKCEGRTHHFPNNSMVCTCGKIDRRKKMMQ